MCHDQQDCLTFVNAMEKKDICTRAQSMKTVKEFAGLLDEIKQDEFGSPKYKITEEQLLHFANVKIPKRYKTFQIRKKSGGLREINAPCYQLAILLYFTNIVLKSLYTPSPSAMGFTEGRSVVDNAKMHVGHHYVFNIDLKDFFPSIPQPRVWARLQLPPFNFTKEIASVVAGLCCYMNADKTQNVLPQGAATSPLLTNAICDTLDRRMRGVAKRFGLHYSRYADDMTFSSMHNVYQEGSDFRVEIKRIIEEQGFAMNDAKTRLLREGRRQEVTGLTVNQVVNVSRQYISDLRWFIHVWETEGYAKAYSKFYPKYKKEKGYVKKGEPVMENVIGGKLNYLRMVRGENNEAYQKLQMRYDKLQQIVYVDNETDSKESYVYVQPYKMADFLVDFSTTISLEVTSKKKLVGKCVLAGMEKVLPISKSTQTALCPDLENRQEGEIITTKKLDNCFVTLCRSKGKNFWLITEFEPQRSKCLSIQNAQIDIDNLLMLWEKQELEKAVATFQESIKTCTTIPSFIYFMIHNKSLTRVQQRKRDALLAKAVVAGQFDTLTKTPEEKKQTPHSPKDTAVFFSLFNRREGLKYLTHNYDSNGMTLTDMLKHVKEVFEEGKRGKNIPESLNSLLYNFLNGKYWLDSEGEKCTDGYGNSSWIEWSVKNDGKHPITDIGGMEATIQRFRHTVRVVAPDLEHIIRRIAGKFPSLRISMTNLDKADFYTNVFVLSSRLTELFKDINDHAGQEYKDVHVEYIPDIAGEFFLHRIRISQIGSFSAKSIENVLRKYESTGGFFYENAEKLKGYCNWSVESLWDGKPVRWNILNDTGVEKTERIDAKDVKGFTHILTFYQKD